MSYMKAFAENVSVAMGLDGEITDEVIEEASRRLFQQCVNRNRNLRSALRAIAGESGSSIPVVVVNAPSNGKPAVTGESWHFETNGGRRIYHPSAYAKVGWSNMHYCCSTRRIEVSADWLADHMHKLVSQRSIVKTMSHHIFAEN